MIEFNPKKEFFIHRDMWFTVTFPFVELETYESGKFPSRPQFVITCRIPGVHGPPDMTVGQLEMFTYLRNKMYKACGEVFGTTDAVVLEEEHDGTYVEYNLLTGFKPFTLGDVTFEEIDATRPDSLPKDDWKIVPENAVMDLVIRLYSHLQDEKPRIYTLTRLRDDEE